MQKNAEVTPEEVRKMKWILVIVALIIIDALTADSLYDFIEVLAGLSLMFLIVRGIVWLGNRVW